MQPNDNKNNHYAEDKDTTERPTSDQPIDPTARKREADDKNGHADEQRWKWPDKLRLFFDGLIAVATVAGVVFLILQFRDTERALDEAKTANRLTQQAVEAANKQIELTDRPWLMVDAEIERAFEVKGDRIELTVRFSIRNIGQSVANDVWPHAEILAEPMADPRQFNLPTERQKSICDAAQAGRFDAFSIIAGRTFFPGEHGFQGLILNTPIAQFAQAANAREFAAFPFPPVVPTIVGCIDYRSAVTGKHHQTGFVYRIVRFDPANPQPALFFNLHQMTVPLSTMRLEKLSSYAQ